LAHLPEIVLRIHTDGASWATCAIISAEVARWGHGAIKRSRPEAQPGGFSFAGRCRREIPLSRADDDPTLETIVAIARSLRPDEFLDLLYEVAADMAEEGVSLEELAVLCESICSRLSIDVGRLLN
jgi:hypothetical protein